MKPTLVALDVQHAFRPKPFQNDRGAVFTMRDGTHVAESDLAMKYAHAARDAILSRVPRSTVVMNDPSKQQLVGRYSDRAAWARAHQVDIYIACHVNAGGGNGSRTYSADHGQMGPVDTESAVLALTISDNLGDGRRGVTLHRGERGWPCIGLVPSPILAVMVEPFFGDHAGELALFSTDSGARVIGHGIANAIGSYLYVSGTPGGRP